MNLAELIVADRARLDALLEAQLEQTALRAEVARLKALQVAASDVLWRWNADTIAPFGIQAKDPSRVSFVQAGGRNAVRLLTMSGDSNLNNSDTWERCDAQHSSDLTNGLSGREQHWKHGIMFPDDYVQPPMSPPNAQPWHAGVVFDFHNSATGGWQANYQVVVYPATGADPGRPTGLHLQVHHGSQADPTKVDAVVQAGAITKNKWYDFKYHVRWASDGTGFFKAWVNGVLHLDHKGPTLYPGQGTYLKLANYHSPHGQASAVLHGPMVLAKTEAGLA